MRQVLDQQHAVASSNVLLAERAQCLEVHALVLEDLLGLLDDVGLSECQANGELVRRGIEQLALLDLELLGRGVRYRVTLCRHRC